MTQQIDDVVHYRGKRFSPYPHGNDGYLFNPRDLGLVASSPHTACYRGFIAQFEIIYNTLYLTDFGIHLLDKEGSPIQGPEIHRVAPLFAPESRGESSIPKSPFRHFNNYYQLRYPLDFTGRLLLGNSDFYFYNNSSICGDAFVREYEEAIGPSWCYLHETLYRVHFKNGKFMKHEDLSELNAGYRAMVEKESEKQQGSQGT